MAEILMHFDGHLDNTGAGDHSIYATGGITTAQQKFGTHSFFSTSGALRAHFTLSASGSMTTEAWVRLNTGGSAQVGFTDADTSEVSLSISASGYIFEKFDNVGSTVFSLSGSGITENVWHHIELTRNGTTWIVFVDGTNVRTQSDTQNYTLAQTAVFATDSYIDEWRVLVGTAAHSANFTPATSAYADETPAPDASFSSVKLLMHGDTSSFLDESLGQNVVTVGGTPAASTAIGGYFGAAQALFASGDSLSWSNVLVTADGSHTVEGFFTFTSFGSPRSHIFGSWNSSAGWTLDVDSGGSFALAVNGTLASSSGGSGISTNTRYHIALVVTIGASSTTATLYLNGSSFVTFTAGAVSSRNSTSSIYAMRVGNRSDGTLPLTAYVDEFRVTTGARYSGTFTVPTLPYAARGLTVIEYQTGSGASRSHGGRRTTSTSGWATIPVLYEIPATGLTYLEFKIDSGGGNVMLGVLNDFLVTSGAFLGQTPTDAVSNGDNYQINGATFTTITATNFVSDGSTVGVAVNQTTGRVRWYKNGTLQAAEASFTPNTPFLQFAVGAFAGRTGATIQQSSATIPSGYTYFLTTPAVTLEADLSAAGAGTPAFNAARALAAALSAAGTGALAGATGNAASGVLGAAGTVALTLNGQAALFQRADLAAAGVGAASFASLSQYAGTVSMSGAGVLAGVSAATAASVAAASGMGVGTFAVATQIRAALAAAGSGTLSAVLGARIGRDMAAAGTGALAAVSGATKRSDLAAAGAGAVAPRGQALVSLSFSFAGGGTLAGLTGTRAPYAIGLRVVQRPVQLSSRAGHEPLTVRTDEASIT